MSVPVVYEHATIGYTSPVRKHIHLGHAIRDAREERGWNQSQLGTAAREVRLPGQAASEEADGIDRINKDTISKAENNPYSRKYGTLARIAGALGKTVGELETYAAVKPLPRVSSHKTVESRGRRRTG